MPEQKDKPDMLNIAQAFVDLLPKNVVEELMKDAAADSEVFIRYLQGVEKLSHEQILSGVISANDEYLNDFLNSFSLEELERIHAHMHYIQTQWPKLHSFVVETIATKRHEEVTENERKAAKAQEN